MSKRKDLETKEERANKSRKTTDDRADGAAPCDWQGEENQGNTVQKCDFFSMFLVCLL